MKKADTPHTTPYNHKPKLLRLSNSDGEYFFAFTEIVCIEASNSQVCVYPMPNGFYPDTIVFSICLKEVEQLLDPLLSVRTHQSWIANLAHVGFYQKHNGHALFMHGNRKVPVAKSKVRSVIEAIERFKTSGY